MKVVRQVQMPVRYVGSFFEGALIVDGRFMRSLAEESIDEALARIIDVIHDLTDRKDVTFMFNVTVESDENSDKSE